MSIILQPFQETDIELITPIMKRAFDEDTKIHLGQESGGPPGYDNGDFLREWALHPNATSFTIYREEEKEKELIGAVILWINSNQENFLGNLFIDSTKQNQGLGAKVWNSIEDQFPQTILWKTETPGFSRRNHYFYVNKCGFKIVNIQNPKDPLESNYLMEKIMA
jgi:N-acetylglutamate synthase-like GNAT family acetyltransferase